MSSREELILAMTAQLDGLTKPRGSLGKLEDYCVKLATIQGRVPPQIRKKAVYVFASDHGVTEEGVSLYPQEVTYQMVLNFLSGGAAINALANGTGWEVIAVDAGVATVFPPARELPKAARFIDKKIGLGTKNFAKEDAMSASDLQRALDAGAELAEDAVSQGYDLVAIGDMGIGNTTTAAALLVAGGLDPDLIIDRGTGIDDAMLLRKRKVILDAVASRGPYKSARDMLRAFGGFDYAMMAGFILGLEGRGIGCILDGFPVSSAAYMAYLLNKAVNSFLYSGHKSRVSGHAPLLAAMGLDPILSLDMRLGEGTGAVLGGFLVELSVKAANEMASFSQAGVSESTLDEKKF
ncbi:nicotinate-nucleotide--dimethylbenzimidazole phosphoribosyltransferase [Treponema sp.]